MGYNLQKGSSICQTGENFQTEFPSVLGFSREKEPIGYVYDLS